MTKQVTGHFYLQGAKHLIWDVLIVEAAKLRPYLDFILDKEIVTQAARQNILMVKYVLHKNPIDTAHNAISFLNSLTEEEMRKENSQDRILLIMWERKVVIKYQHLDTVQVKKDIMNHQIKEFIELFNPLFKRGLPFFWGEKGGMWSQKDYNDRLISCILDHR